MNRTKTNKFYLAVLSLLFVLSAIFCTFSLAKTDKANAFGTSVTDIKAEFDKGNDFFMLGASARIDGTNGLRFVAAIEPSLAESVVEDENKSFNAFIIGVDWFNYLLPAAKQEYTEDYNYLSNLKSLYPGTLSEIKDIEPVAVYDNEEIAYYELRATLSNLKYMNNGRNFFGMIYIKDDTSEPAEYTFANYDEANKRNLAYVSSKVLTENFDRYNSSEKTTLYNAMKLAALYSAGVSESTATANLSSANYGYEVVLNKSAITLAVDDTFDISAYLNVDTDGDGACDDALLISHPIYVKYAITSGSSYISLSGNTVTAISGGDPDEDVDAVIMATYVTKDGSGIKLATTTIDVNVLAEASITYETITECTNDQRYTVSKTNSDYTLSVVNTFDNDDQGVNSNHGAYAKIAHTGEVTSVTFTINNTSTTKDLYLGVIAQEQYGTYKTKYTPTGATSSGSDFYDDIDGDYGAKLSCISKNSSATVTITFGSDISNNNVYGNIQKQVNLKFSPWKLFTGGTFTITDIYFGAGGSAETDNRLSVSASTPSNGTLSVDCSQALEGDTVYVIAKPANGYTLSAINVNGDPIVGNSFEMPDEDVTVTATFTKISYTLNNGGFDVKFKVGENLGATSAQIGDTVQIIPDNGDATVVGFTYDSMSRRSGNVVEDDDSFTMEYDNVRLTGITLVYPITVTNGVAKINGTTVTEAQEGDTIDIIANTPATGKAFAGWVVEDDVVTLDDDSDDTTFFTMEDAAVSITATYDWIDYDVINDVDDDVTVKVNGSAASTAHYGDTISLVSNDDDKLVSSFKYTVDGGDKITVNTTSFSMPAGDVVITDVTLADKVVKYSISVTGGEADYDETTAGTTVTVTAGSVSGKRFVGWTSSDVTFDDASASETTFEMPAKNVTITANFATLYSITVTDGTSDVATAIEGETVTITAGSVSGKRFTGWSTSDVTLDDSSASETTFEMPAKNVSITANQATLYSITVTGGTSDVATAIEGETVTITASSISGKRFTGWSTSDTTLDSTSASETTFEMPAKNVSITANQATLYSITVTDGTSDVATAITGETVTITANTPASGYAFDGWTVTAGSVTLDDDSSSSTTFTMGTADVSVEAGYRSTITYSTLHSVGRYGNGSIDSITADTSTSATIRPNMGYGGGGQEAHWQYVEVNGASGKSILTFTLNADQSKTIGVAVVATMDEYAYNNNKLYSLSGVTAGGSAATSYGKGIYTFSATQNTDITITITLSDALSTSTANIFIWPYAGGGYTSGTIVVKNFYFVTPTSYDISVNSSLGGGVTSSDVSVASSAYSGATVTLSAKNSGKVVSGFTYTSSAGGDTVTGNSFTMPAADVTITAVTLADKSSENISVAYKFGGSSGAGTSGSGTDTLAITNASGNDEWNCVAVTIANMVGKQTISITIENTGSNTYNFLIWMATGNGQYSDSRSISSATNASTGGNKGGVTGSINSGSSLTVTITLSSSIASGDNLRFAFTGSYVTVSYTLSDASVS